VARQLITDLKLLAVLGAVLAYDIIISAAYFGSTPPRLELVADLGDSSRDVLVCSYDSYEALAVLQGVPKALTLVLGVWLAFLVRNVQYNFNESKSLVLVSIASALRLPPPSRTDLPAGAGRRAGADGAGRRHVPHLLAPSRVRAARHHRRHRRRPLQRRPHHAAAALRDHHPAQSPHAQELGAAGERARRHHGE
jgi:hypothetical protein